MDRSHHETFRDPEPASSDHFLVSHKQVSQEVPAPLERLPDGEYRNSHAGFQDFYATPIHLLGGPTMTYLTRTANAVEPHAFREGSAASAVDGSVQVTERNGWPSYVAKAVIGTVRIADDGSANFTAPTGKVLYFHLLRLALWLAAFQGRTAHLRHAAEPAVYRAGRPGA